MRTGRVWIAAVVAAIATVGGLSKSAHGEPDGNAVADWNSIAATSTISTAGQSPQAAVLSLAMVQGAVYDAVNAIDGGYTPYLTAPAAERSYSETAAAATAAFRVLV